jgi:tRNA C32,U32 (ribose-2'-O)-methylase TrmJ
MKFLLQPAQRYRRGDVDLLALDSGFFVPDSGSRLRERWRRLFSRVPALEREEVNILRGLLRALLAKRSGK